METIGAVLADHALDAAAALRSRPLLVGITGGVGVGKTAAAASLVEALAGRGLEATCLSTDSFLHPNAVLAAQGLLVRKGFPETFDDALAATTVARLAAGEGPVDVPVYSHAIYDVVPDQTDRVGAADVVVVEGIFALQPAVADHLHLGVYLDAPESVLRGWFVDRFLDLCRLAESDDTSFYRLFVGLDEDARRAQAVAVWDGVNAVNLREHILPTGARAHLVVEKGAGHTVVGVRRQLPPAG